MGRTAVFFIAVFALVGIIAGAALAQRVPVRMATADVGSYGYAVSSILADVLNRELPSQYVVTVHPYPNTTAAMRAAMNGEAEMSYTADVGMTELYARVGPYQGFTPRVGDLVHTLYVYPMESFLTVPADQAENIDSWGDLSGKPVYFTPAGYMNWINFQRVFNALGYEFNHVEIDSSLLADALRAGSIVGAGSYTTAGASLPTFWKEAELRIAIKVVNPSPEEVAKLEAAGLAPRRVDPSRAFTRDVGVDEILGVPILFAYNMRADADPELVYQILTALEKAAPGLPALDPGFTPLAEDFVGIQVAGISANPHIPVHAGLARFLQERGAWDDSWTIAK
ncbi:MAG TPA: TAXI family TRAP transporter solute-binding subunit [Limnochordales bacterium]